jgi:hypothetical protein
VAPGTSFGRGFEYRDLEGIFDVTISHGMTFRMEDRDPRIVAAANGGSSRNANVDDGNLNFDTGLVSNMVRIDGQLALLAGGFGLFARGGAFYDFEIEDNDTQRTPLTRDARDRVGQDADLRELYLSFRQSPGGTPINVRVGQQVLNWGETNFIRDGIDIINPFDFVAALQPATRPQDVLVPQGMIWSAANITPLLSVEGYYQYDWEALVLPPIGTYYSVNDLAGAGGTSAFTYGAGAVSDLGTNLDSRFDLPAGTLGFDPIFMKLPARGVDNASNDGQYGVKIQGIFPNRNATKLAFHYVRYHSRLPLFSAVTADAEAVAATSPAAVAARAAPLVPIYLQQGLSPDEAQSAALAAAEDLTLSGYENQAGLLVSFPEDIDMYGASFSTSTMRTGSLFAGDVSHHRDVPMQVSLGTLTQAVLSPVLFDPTIGDTALGEFGPSEVVSGIERLNKTQTTLELTQLAGSRLGADQVLASVNVGWVHIHGFPDGDEAPLQAPLPTDQDSWGYRLTLLMRYSGVFGGIGLEPRVVFAHDVNGTTPAPYGTFIEDRKLFSVGVTANWINRLTADIEYTTFFDAGAGNLLIDRDTLRIRWTYSL